MSRLDDTDLRPRHRRGEWNRPHSIRFEPGSGEPHGPHRSSRSKSMLPDPTFDSLTANLFAQGKYQFNSQKMDARDQLERQRKTHPIRSRRNTGPPFRKRGPILGELLRRAVL